MIFHPFTKAQMDYPRQLLEPDCPIYVLQDEAMLSEWKRELEKDVIWRVKKKFRTV